MLRWTKTSLMIFVFFAIISVYLAYEYLPLVFAERDVIYPAPEEVGSVHKYPIQGQLPLDMNRPSYRLWEDDGPSNLCYKFETRFGIDLKRVWLLSYPGSGNTWARYLIEAATGVFTGSVYKDKLLYKKGYLGEFEDVTAGTTLTQKSHGSSLFQVPNSFHTLYRYNFITSDIPCVLLIRDPRRAIVSHWNFLSHNGLNSHIAKALESSFQTKAFHKFVMIRLLQWEQLIIDRLLWTNEPVYVMYYENLKNNVTHEVRNLLGFLGVPVNEERLNCISLHMKGSFKREGKEFDPFNEDEKKSMAASVKLVRRLLKRLGYPELPSYDGL